MLIMVNTNIKLNVIYCFPKTCWPTNNEDTFKYVETLIVGTIVNKKKNNNKKIIWLFF